MIWFYSQNQKRSSDFFRNVMSCRIELCEKARKNDNKNGIWNGHALSSSYAILFFRDIYWISLTSIFVAWWMSYPDIRPHHSLSNVPIYCFLRVLCNRHHAVPWFSFQSSDGWRRVQLRFHQGWQPDYAGFVQWFVPNLSRTLSRTSITLCWDIRLPWCLLRVFKISWSINSMKGPESAVAVLCCIAL